MNKKLFFTVFTALVMSVGLFSIQPVKADQTTQSSAVEKTVIQPEKDGQVAKASTAVSPIDYGSQYFTQVSFTDLAGNSLAKVDDSDKIKVNYSFSIPGSVHENDTMTIQLPEQLQMVNYKDFSIMDASGAVIANASTDKTTGLVTLTFTNEVENKTDITGSLFFWAKFDVDKVSDGANVFPMSVRGTTQDLTLNVHKTSTGVGTGTTNPTVIFKSGSFDKNNPSLIDWTVTVNNAQQNLLQPKVIDTIGAGQTLVSGTLSFNYRDENKKSLKKFTLGAGAEVAEGQTKATTTATGFEVILENLGSYSTINHYSSVVITYQTQVDGSVNRYTNNASTTDESGNPQQRNASVIDYGSGGSASGTTQQAIDTLTNTIDTATSIDPGVLTPDDVTQLTDSTTNAQNVVDNETSTKEQLDTTNTELGQVINEVTPPIENDVTRALEKLTQLVNDTKLKDSNLYTDKSWQGVEEAIKASETLLNNEKEHPGTTSLVEIQESLTKLNQAVDALVTKAHETLENALTDLQKLVNTAETKDETLYTKETWDVLITAKEEAKQTLTAGINNVTLEQVLIQQNQLQTAIDGLKEKEKVPSNSSNSNSLPATGEGANYFITLLGLGILIFASIIKIQLLKG